MTNQNPRNTKSQSRHGSLLWWIKRAQKRVIVAWVRFARRHRDSNLLPIGLFCILFFDGFVVVMPSMIITGAAVTITPRRWWLFALIFVLAMTANNYLLYWVGRVMPADMILAAIQVLNLETVYESADRALTNYGSLAAFLGALVSLPVQMITVMLGMSDSQLVLEGKPASVAIYKVIVLAGLGHLIKMLIFCSIIRYGWVKLEQKVVEELKAMGSRTQ